MTSVDIFHINDFHRRLTPLNNGDGGAARLATVAREQLQRHPDAILVNVGDVAGDQTAPSPDAYEPLPQIFNRMGVSIATLGNHEFEDASGGYASLREGYINRLAAQTLCANVTDTSDRPIEGTKPYTIRQLAGMNVAFIGVVTENLTSAIHPTAGAALRVARMENVLADLVPRVRAEGADAVVVMAHEGLRESARLAQEVPGIDLVLSAHDHRTTPTPIVVAHEDGTTTWVAEAGAYGTSVGHVRLMFDENRHVCGVEGSQIGVTPSVAPDPVVAAIVEGYRPLAKVVHQPERHKWQTVALADLAKQIGAA